MPNRHEFRATTDQMLEILDELRSLEHQKRAVSVGSPEFLKLAEAAAEHGRLAFRWSQLQLQMAQETATRAAEGRQEPGIPPRRRSATAHGPHPRSLARGADPP